MFAISKLSLVQQILLGLLIFANLFVGGYVLYARQPQAIPTKLIPASEVIGNSLIRKRIDELLAQNKTQQIAVALLTSASTSCSTGKLVEIFKKSAQHSDSKKFIVILPSRFSEQDVENFKTNFDANFEVGKADDELSQQWLPLASKYEALGVVIISDNGKLTVSQEAAEIEKHLASFE